ncbi:RDD family protein [Terriglobus saanensis]|uniref:RDD domain containing protein n=1 Tax=Terriglobus saanensis (strain ATCC BAA-1853 / DSM 23119 / SP1PR4) TaxID=401053 RepID=E8V3Q1_TERSS|nr:RDD family protein [Terriglobus saanensis]ADV84738.1 RDD domain containing protein [Terriglobus saanensis SP1PR4]
MSSVSTLPLEPFEPESAPLLKQQVAERLAQHRRRRGQDLIPQALPSESEKSHPVAAAVAARFSQTVSYRDFLAAEAEAATRKAEMEIQQAEAAAEIARRNAEAIATAQRELMEEIANWNARIAAANAANPHLVEAGAAPQPVLVEASVEMVVATPVESVTELLQEVAIDPTATEETVLQAAAIAAEPLVSEKASEKIAGPVTQNTAIEKTMVAAPPAFSIRAELESSLPAEPAVAIPANLIEFPRQLVAARKARPRLAEGPLREEASAAPDKSQLRIFEVEPEMLSPQPPVANALPEWSSIRLDASTEPYAPASLAAQLSFVLPPQTASLQLRTMAAAVDLCCIGAAFVAFAATVAYVSPELPGGKIALMGSAGVLLALTLLYQGLFFTISDATPGMRYARIALCTFSDENPSRSAMRRRILAMLLAACPVGIGFLWACLDDDGLGWHDRMSRMYPRGY